MVPRASFAAFSGTGSGTSGDPYMVTTCEDLQSIPDDVPAGEYYMIPPSSHSIDCSATSGWNGGAGFAPISNFGGDFNGNSKPITGLTINRPLQDSVGLFSTTASGASINFITLSAESITGHSSTGGVIGTANGELSLSNIETSGSVTGFNGVGGIVGDYEFHSDDGGEKFASIVQIQSNADVIANDWVGGGLFGYIYSRVTDGSVQLSFMNATHNGSVTVTHGESGGIIGEVQTYADSNVGGAISSYAFSGMHSTSSVSAGDAGSAGGLIGYMSGQTLHSNIYFSLTDSYHTLGDVVSGASDTGGLVGTAVMSGGAGPINLTLTGLYSNGVVTSTGLRTGGLFGYLRLSGVDTSSVGLNFANNYHSGGAVTGTSLVGGIAGLFEADQTFGSGKIRSIFTNLYANGAVVSMNANPGEGDNIGGLFGQVATIAELDTSSTSDDFTVYTSFSNMYHTVGMVSGDHNIGGIIGGFDLRNDSIDGASVSLTFSDVYSTTAVSGLSSVGGLIGYAYDGYSTVFQVSRSYHSSGEVQATNGEVGGLVGGFRLNDFGNVNENSVTFSELYATGDVTASGVNYGYAGGLFGHIWKSNSDSATVVHINDSYYSGGTVRGSNRVGGICGWTSWTALARTYASGSVVGTSHLFTGSSDGVGGIGGLIGEMFTGTQSVTNSFSVVNVSTTDPELTRSSGLVGTDDDSSVVYTNNYYETAATGSYVGTKTAPPLNTWDFGGIWYAHTGVLPDFDPTNPLPDPSSTPTPTIVPYRGLPAFLIAVPAQQPQVVHDPVVVVIPTLPLEKPLKLNSKGLDVMKVQKNLNAKGFTVAKAGAGSPGKETSVFGIKTKLAVIKFQKAKGLEPNGVVTDTVLSMLYQYPNRNEKTSAHKNP